VNVWNVKGFKKIGSFSGHQSWVLYLAISPCGKYIVTGAGDETLRFWDLAYKEKKSEKKKNIGELFSFKGMR